MRGWPTWNQSGELKTWKLITGWREVDNKDSICFIVFKIVCSIYIAGVAEIILRTQTKMSLKCMAAKAVKNYNITYRGQVPQSLESFIELHGPGVKQG